MLVGEQPSLETLALVCAGSVSRQGWPQSTVLAVPCALGKETQSA